MPDLVKVQGQLKLSFEAVLKGIEGYSNYRHDGLPEGVYFGAKSDPEGRYLCFINNDGSLLRTSIYDKDLKAQWYEVKVAQTYEEKIQSAKEAIESVEKSRQITNQQYDKNIEYLKTHIRAYEKKLSEKSKETENKNGSEF